MVNTLDDSRLSTVLDVKVQLSVRLGSCQMAMRDVLELQAGTVVPVSCTHLTLPTNREV